VTVLLEYINPRLFILGFMVQVVIFSAAEEYRNYFRKYLGINNRLIKRRIARKNNK